MREDNTIRWYLKSILNGYSQVFFSDQKAFAIILLVITFVDFYTGLTGLLSVIITTGLAHWMGFDKFKIHQGYYGFNALLVGLGMGIYFQPGMLLVLLVILAAVLTLFLSISLEGVIGKYALPHLSLPFVFSLWAVMLASREFQALGLNERG
ncbi:MAG: urea transporter, partial [Bacteroidales bacterium]